MPDIVIPNTLNFARARFRLIENVGVSRALYTGRTRTSELGGDRAGCSLEAAPSMAAQRAALKAFAMQAGKRNRVFLYDPGYRPRGSFPATELLTNADFSQGTTGFGLVACAITASNGVMRISAIRGFDGTTVPQVNNSESAGVLYAPYALRQFTLAGRGNMGTAGPYFNAGVGVEAASYGAYGLQTANLVAGSTDFGIALVAGNAISGYGSGDYVDVPFVSLARCMLADGGENLLLNSQTPGTGTGWSLNAATAGANGTAAPDGTISARFLQETTATDAHYATQTVAVSASAQDVTFSVYVAFISPRTRCWLYLQETTGAQNAVAWFNSSGVTSTSLSGGNWSNIRTTTTNVGGGWYRFSITARKTNAATSIAALFGPTTADGVTTYAGSTSTGLLTWGASLSRSGVAARLTPTTAAATPIGGAAQSGPAIYVKGLPASTNGLLLAGDWVEIITSQGSELKMLTASLDSDAAGLGFLQFAPALRGTVADNAPIIVHRPMGRFISTADAIEYQDEPGIVTTSSFDFEEG
jgi:hypothetical protein